MKRRTFISTLAAGAALAAATQVRAQSITSARRRVGLIGCGWYGGVDLLRLAQVEPIDVVSLCDVDRDALVTTRKLVATWKGNEPETFGDYRQMLARRNLDIVLVATPDHWHALPAVAAMQTGADVYLEKPVGVDVIEGDALVAAARKYERVVQVGPQRRSMPHLVEARERIVRAGKLGRIGLVEGFCYWHMRSQDRTEGIEPPESLDYDMWTGPAPLRPFLGTMHPRGWRAFMEYGNGIMGDMGVHMVDMIRWMLGLGWPRAVTSSGGIHVHTDASANITDTQLAIFDYGDLEITWQHRTWGLAPNPDEHWSKQWGAIIHGGNGTLRLTSVDYDFRSADDGGHIQRDADNEDIDRSNRNLDEVDLGAAPAERQHMRDFLHAIDRRENPVAVIAEAHVSTACCVLANLSMELGRTLRNHPETRSIPDDAEATARLRRPYRRPWVHPEPHRV